MSVLRRYRPKYRLTECVARALRGKLVRALTERVNAAYLFGSIVGSDFHDNSDVDLLIVSETKLPFTKRAVAFQDLLELFPRIDVLVYTPREFERLWNEPQEGFLSSFRRSCERLL